MLALGLMPMDGFCDIDGEGSGGFEGCCGALKSSMGGSSFLSDGCLSLLSSWRRFSRLSTRLRRASGGCQRAQSGTRLRFCSPMASVLGPRFLGTASGGGYR